ncbi:hypothetical protein B9Z55_021438 [Caenorhabditis nigoni]|uniref:Uncharacterized protein n=1 Tax=Caenorhabditis nigoni TaxID=1611254 RepID=A0A2G5TS52_9PELO|nr:hypothetical protein B9Z55_021438 [Caenorhabditis nigoni]
MLARKWKFYDIILLETVETTNYTYSPYPEYREELRNLENMKRQRYFQNEYIDALQEMFLEWSPLSFGIDLQLMISIPNYWLGRLDVHRFNVLYPLRKLACFVLSKKFPTNFLEAPRYFHVVLCGLHIHHYSMLLGNRINLFRQLMILEFIYIVAKYTVDDIRSVIWPFILVNEIWDVFTVFKYRTTEFLPFELQLWKFVQTLEHFLLLNQYPDFYILIWLTVIATLQIVSFFMYFLFPPLTWTVPILNIAPTRAPKNRYMIYSRYVAIAFVLLIFWALSGGMPHICVILSFFATILVYHIAKIIYIKYYYLPYLRGLLQNEAL